MVFNFHRLLLLLPVAGSVLTTLANDQPQALCCLAALVYNGLQLSVAYTHFIEGPASRDSRAPVQSTPHSLILQPRKPIYDTAAVHILSLIHI